MKLALFKRVLMAEMEWAIRVNVLIRCTPACGTIKNVTFFESILHHVHEGSHASRFWTFSGIGGRINSGRAGGSAATTVGVPDQRA